MSEIRSVLANAIADRRPVFGDNVVNLRTGRIFTAEIQEITDSMLYTAMGGDPRSTALFFITESWVANQIQPGDELKALGATFEILAGQSPNNPVSTQYKFQAMKLEPGLDQ